MDINLWGVFKNIISTIWVSRSIWLFMAAIFVIVLMIKVALPKEINKLIRAIKYNKRRRRKKDGEFIRELQSMKPKEFEEFIAELFSRLGYKTRAVGKSHDRGIDVIAKKDGVKHYIQCKKYITSKVTVKDVRGFYGALVDHFADGKGFFITTNKFTLDAEKFAEDKPIELIDNYKLIKYIKMSEKSNDVSGKKTQTKCPLCGGELVKRNGKHGFFYGCSNYPKCHFTKKL